MSQRESNLLWLKDLLEHLTTCRQRLEWVADADAVRVVTETMLDDLERCKRLCENIQRRARVRSAV